uniref:Uncharacterized protein n=1 Tax=Romanomermis culicivorax TaxID=13658 RepID=A0A915HFL1_ROMCU
LLYFDIESIQQFSAGTLTEIAADVEGCQQIEQNGAVAQLTELLHSRNEHIATYAAAVLHALSQTKPPEYQQHLGVELTSSLFRDDSTPWSQDVLNDMPQVNEDVFNTYNGYDHSNYDGYALGPGNLMDYDSVSSGGAGIRPVGGAGAPPPSARGAQQPQQQPPLTDWYDTNL